MQLWPVLDFNCKIRRIYSVSDSKTHFYIQAILCKSICFKAFKSWRQSFSNAPSTIIFGLLVLAQQQGKNLNIFGKYNFDLKSNSVDAVHRKSNLYSCRVPLSISIDLINATIKLPYPYLWQMWMPLLTFVKNGSRIFFVSCRLHIIRSL